MTTTGHARKLMKKCLDTQSGALHKLACVQLLIETAIVAGVTALLQFKVNMPYLALIAVFIWSLASLLMTAPLMSIARRRGEGAASHMNFGRYAIALLLATLPVWPTWGVTTLLGQINTQWQPLMSWVLASGQNIALFGAAFVLAIVLLVFVYSVLGVFSRQFMLYMAESEERMSARAAGRMLANAFRRAYAPTALFFSGLGWYVLMLVLLISFTGAACALTASISLGDGLQMLALQVMAALLSLAPWVWGVIFALGGVWMLGLNVIFWPRASMTRLYYHRLIMRDTDIL